MPFYDHAQLHASRQFSTKEDYADMASRSAHRGAGRTSEEEFHFPRNGKLHSRFDRSAHRFATVAVVELFPPFDVFAIGFERFGVQSHGGRGRGWSVVED